MFDHRYLSEMSKALHIYRDFSFLAWGVLILVRVAAVAQTALARVQRVQPRSGNQAGP
jgi:hypothetical protein